MTIRNNIRKKKNEATDLIFFFFFRKIILFDYSQKKRDERGKNEIKKYYRFEEKVGLRRPNKIKY